MAAVPQFNGLGTGTANAFNLTRYWNPISPIPGVFTTEAPAQIRIRTATVYSKLSCLVSVNTIATSATVYRLRVAGANGNQSISVAAGATGTFQDLVNSDTIAANTLVAISIVTPNTSGSITTQALWFLASADVNTTVRLSARNALAPYNSDRFGPIGGATSVSETAAAATSLRNPADGERTVDNLFTSVSSNPSGTTMTVSFNRNGVNLSLAAAISAGATGIFEDVGDPQTADFNDLLCYHCSGSNTASNIGFNVFASVEVTTPTTLGWMVAGPSTETINASVTCYGSFGGDTLRGGITTESNAALAMLNQVRVSGLTAKININGVTATSTFTTRKNSGAGAQSITITSGATGIFEDITNVDRYEPTDTGNVKMVTGGSGTSLRMAAYGASAQFGNPWNVYAQQ